MTDELEGAVERLVLADPNTVLAVLAHLVLEGRATPKQQDELLAALSLSTPPLGSAETRGHLEEWTVAPQQNRDCIINGFYAVGPLRSGPPVAYVFGKENADRIAALSPSAPPLSRVERETASCTDSASEGPSGPFASDGQRKSEGGAA